MQDTYFNKAQPTFQNVNGAQPSNPSTLGGSQSSAQKAAIDELTRIFNTALVSTRAKNLRDSSAELYALLQAPAFRVILGSIRQLSAQQGISELEAAEKVIETFRRIDEIWSDCIFQEGVNQLKGPTC